MLECIKHCSVCYMQCPTNYTQHDVRFLSLYPLCDQQIQPGSVNGIILETWCLQKFNQILHCCTEISSDRQFLQRNHKVPIAETAACQSSYNKVVTKLKSKVTIVPITAWRYTENEVVKSMFHLDLDWKHWSASWGGICLDGLRRTQNSSYQYS